MTRYILIFSLLSKDSSQNIQFPVLQAESRRSCKLEILSNGMLYVCIDNDEGSHHYLYFPNGTLNSHLSIVCDREFWVSTALIHKEKLARIVFGWWENKPQEIDAPIPFKKKNLSTLFFVGENGMTSSLCETGNTQLQAYAIDDAETRLACLTENHKSLNLYWFDISAKTLKLLQKRLLPAIVPSLFYQYAYTLFFVQNNLFLSCYKKNDSMNDTSIFSINPETLPLCIKLIYKLNKCFDIHITPENDLVFIESRQLFDGLNKERTILVMPFFQALKLASLMKEWREKKVKKISEKKPTNSNEN